MKEQHDTAQAASSAVLKAIREANMQLVRTGDNAFMLVPYKVATAQAAESVPAPVAAFEVADAMADSQYLAGVSAGWNAANADDPNAALQKLHESRAGYLKPLATARAPAESVGRDAEDAARWRMLPAFFEEYQIDAMKLYRDIDSALAANGGNK